MIKTKPSTHELILLALQLTGVSSRTNLVRKMVHVFGDIITAPIMKDKQTEFIYTAAQNDNMATLKYLMQIGFDINAKDDSHWTALHIASFKGMGVAVCNLLCLGADPTRLSKRSTPRELAKRIDIEAIFDEFEKLPREELIQKYRPGWTAGSEELKTEMDVTTQDVTDFFPVLELPLELLMEVYDRVPILSANTMQKLVCKGWQHELKTRFEAKFPYLDTNWAVSETGGVECEALPSVIHFLARCPYATKQKFGYMASLYDKFNRELEKAAGNITYLGDRAVTKKFDPKEFKQFLFGITRRAEVIHVRSHEFSLVVFVTDVHENYGIFFKFTSVKKPNDFMLNHG